MQSVADKFEDSALTEAECYLSEMCGGTTIEYYELLDSHVDSVMSKAFDDLYHSIMNDMQ